MTTSLAESTAVQPRRRPLLRAKLQIPPLHSELVPRPRLTRHLRAALAHKLTLVSAPAGYGKTTLLASFAENSAFNTVDVPLVWYTLDDSDNDLFTFVDYLVTGIEAQRPGFGAPVRDLLKDTKAAAHGRWIAAEFSATEFSATVLLNELAQDDDPLLIILDDYHAITSHEIHEVLDFLLAHLPPHVHLAIGTRVDPPLSLARLRARGQLLEVRVQDLRFTLDETTQFLRGAAAPLSISDATALKEKTGGWAAALQLAVTSLGPRDRDQWSELIRDFSGATEALFDYLADEIYVNQPPEVQTFLVRSAILRDMSAELCNDVLEIENSEAILTSLVQANLFTLPSDAAHTTYRYHDLFREFLLRRLREGPAGSSAAESAAAEDPAARDETIRRLHRRAGAWFLEQDDDERAVQHLLDAGEYDTAADLIRSLQRRLLFTSRYHLLERWLEQFPPKIIETYPRLLLIQARIANLQGDYSRAEALCLQAEPCLQATDDRAGLYTAYHQLAKIAKDRGALDEAQALYRQAFEHATDDLQRAVAMGQGARCHYLQRGEVQEVLSTLDEAVALSKQGGHLLGRAGLLSIKGNMLSSLGDFTGALDAWHTALDLMETYGNQHQQITILNNAAYLHCLLGEFDQAEPLVKRAFELAQMFRRPTVHAYALNIRGVIHQGRSDTQPSAASDHLSAARRCHEEALAIQRRTNARYEIPTTLNHLALLARREGKLGEALHRGEEGLTLREKMDSDYEIGLSLIDVGAIHLALSHEEQAESMWRRALDIFTDHSARYEQAQLHFYLAVLAHRRAENAAEDGRGGGQGSLALHLERAMSLASTYERPFPSGGEHRRTHRCLHFFVAEADWAAPLLARALQRGLVTRCVDCLLPRLGDPALRALLPLLDAPAEGSVADSAAEPAAESVDESPVDSAEVRAHAARLLGRLGDASALKPLASHAKDPEATVRHAVDEALETLAHTPPEPLRVQTLGSFRLWRGGMNDVPGREITDWPRRSARDVLLLLLLHHPQPVASEVLAEALWPGSPPDKSSQNLRRAISDLRRTLEPELPSRFPSRYLAVSSETYALVLPSGSQVDDVAFERDLSAALRAPPPSTPEERQAAIGTLEAVLGRYTGDYLAELPFEDWTLARREYLRHLLIRGTHRLARLHLEAGQFDEAIAAAHCALAQELWDEDATFILMRAHASLENIPAALRAYETLRERLDQDLDLPPRDDLTALYHRLRQR